MSATSTVTELSGVLADGVSLWRHIVGIALLLALLALAAIVTAVILPGPTPRRRRRDAEEDRDV